MIPANKPSTINKKLLIDRIWKDTKYESKQTKDSLTSSAITQASPNQEKSNDSFLKNFFLDFQSRCRVQHHQVPTPLRPPLYRNLKPQFLQARSRYYRKQSAQNPMAKKHQKTALNISKQNRDRNQRVNTENYYSQKTYSQSLDNNRNGKTYQNTYGIQKHRMYRNQSMETLNQKMENQRYQQPQRLKPASSYKLLPSRGAPLKPEQKLRIIRNQLKQIYNSRKQPINLNGRAESLKKYLPSKY